MVRAAGGDVIEQLKLMRDAAEWRKSRLDYDAEDYWTKDARLSDLIGYLEYAIEAAEKLEGLS
jgi:hypothetical protein